LALAEQVDWLDRQHRTGSRIQSQEPVELDALSKHTQPGRVPTPREEVPRSSAQNFSGKRAAELLARAKTFDFLADRCPEAFSQFNE
jgi:hypothetical protein